MDSIGYQNVPRSAQLTVQFDELLAAQSLSHATLRRSPSNVLEPATVSLGADGASLRLVPLSQLPSTTSFNLSVSGVTDLDGNPASGSVTFRTEDVVGPTVALVRHDSGTPVESGDRFAAGVSWAFDVNATDDSGGVASRTLTVDGTPVPVGSDGVFRYTWPASAAGTTPLLIARAQDGSGNARQVEVTVQVVSDIPPTVTFTQPAATALTLEEGEQLDVVLSASDNSKVASVELRLDGVSQKWSTGLTAPTATLTHKLRMAPVSSAAEQRVLTGIATDDGGLVATAAPITLTVTPDTTSPTVSLLSPVAGAQLPSGGSVDIQASAADRNGIGEVELLVDGTSVARLSTGPYLVTWTAPVVSAATSFTIQARASDRRGNVSTASRTVTVAPTALGPSAYLETPNDGTTVQEETSLAVKVNASGPRPIREVRLSFAGVQVALRSPPYSYTFTTPFVDAESRYPLTAEAEDLQGVVSPAAVHTVVVTPRSDSAPTLSMDAAPEGPYFLGGSELSMALTAPAGASVVSSVTVSGTAAPRGSDTPGGRRTYPLPLSPEGAPVQVTAVTTTSGGSATASTSGTLAIFATGPTTRQPLTPPMTTPRVAIDGQRVYVLRDDPGGAGAVELRSAGDLSLLSQVPLTVRPVGLAAAGGRVLVAGRDGGAGLLLVLDGATLAEVSRAVLRRSPTAVAAVPSGAAIGTDEGVELWTSSGLRWSRFHLGTVSALASEGRTLFAVEGGSLSAIDLTLPWAPQKMGSTTLAGAPTAVAISGAGPVCALGVAAECFAFSGGTFSPIGQRALTAPALDGGPAGALLWVSTSEALLFLDPRGGTVRVTGRYPALAGVAAFREGLGVAARGGALHRLEVTRNRAPPVVTLSPPSQAAPGARVALNATVQVAGDPLGGYAAELLIDGRVVEVRHGELPGTVDLPATGSSAVVSLRVRELGGQSGVAAATVALADDGLGPALLSLVAPAEVLERTEVACAAVPADPSRVAAVEVTLEGSAPVTLAAPALAGTLAAPSVATDTTLSLTAVAIDSSGRRGPPVTTGVRVKDDLGAAPTVSVTRVGTGPVIEGAAIGALATVSPAAVREVRFFVDGVEQQRVARAPYQASLVMPMGTGSRTALVQAVAVDLQGRLSAPGALTLTVVDDLFVPGFILTVEPAQSRVAAGSRITAIASTTDASSTSSPVRIALRLDVGGTTVATGAGLLEHVLAASTAPATLVLLEMTATDLAGNAITTQRGWTVVPAESPALVSTTAGPLVDAQEILVQGDRALVRVPSGLVVAQIQRGAQPALTVLSSYTSRAPALDLAASGRFAFLAMGASGLEVVEIGDSGAATLRGYLAADVASVVAHGSVVAGGQTSTAQGSYLIDVTDPARPIATSSSRLPGWGRMLAGSADGALAADGNTFLVSRSGSYSAITITGEVVRAAAADREWFFAATDKQLRLYDSLVGLQANLATGAGARSLRVAGGRAYVAGEDGWLRIFDVREPRALALVAMEALDARDVEVSGDLLLAATPAGVELRRLPQLPAAPGTTAAASLPLSVPVQGLTEYRGGVLVAAGLAGLRSYDLLRPDAFGTRATLSVAAAKQVERVERDLYFLDGTQLKWAREANDGAVTLVNDAKSTRLAQLGAISRFSVSPQRLWAVGGGAVSTAALPDVTGPAVVVLSGAVDVWGDGRFAAVARGANGWSLLGADASGVARLLASFPGAAADAVALSDDLVVVGDSSGISTYR
ncbi:MAG TPA: Ig-like domain-containing protein, partial [Myxococcales bacterium]|nr:Ig-like domain-containing protein [Myxococcales bacterium]